MKRAPASSSETVVAAGLVIAISAFFAFGGAGCSSSTSSMSSATPTASDTGDAGTVVDLGDDAASSGASDAAAVVTHGTDNAAIVDISTMMLAGSLDAPTLDAYNLEDPYAVKSTSYLSTFAQRLAGFDSYDGATDWEPTAAGSWVARISAGNYLVVDPSKPCAYTNGHTYLEIERAALTGADSQTCGGRAPNEDSFDVTLNFLVRGPKGLATDPNALHDGVDQAGSPSTTAFPYLAEMNGL